MHGQRRRSGFTLIEILVVLAIIGILSSYVLASLWDARNEAYTSTALQQMKQFESALELYLIDTAGVYPADVNRDIPPGVEQYLTSGDWPSAPWPGSVFDWDNWDSGNLSYAPKEQVVQLSVRFCEIGQPATCRFPDEPWAQNFDVNSSAYWCLTGPCRAHSAEPLNHPAYCMNCN